MKKKILSFILITTMMFLAAAQVWAGEDNEAINYNLGNVIVSATKTETYQAEIGSSTTVITAEDIEKSGKRTVEEVLRDIPGLTVMQTGAMGGAVSVFMRGANSGQTLVMIDGIEVNDPIDSSRAFNFANLLTDNIERIEVVRGPQSTLYGSDAMAGVINIITKKGEGKLKTDVSFEGGSHNSFSESVALRGTTAEDKLNYSFSTTRLDSDSISTISGLEKDPYHNLSLSSKMGYKVFDNAELNLVMCYTDARKSIDDSDAVTYDPIDMQNYTSWSRDLAAKISFDQSIASWWMHSLSYSHHDIRRKDRKSWDPHNQTIISDWYKGNNKKVEWQHNISPVKWDTVTAGFEYERESGASSYTIIPDPYGYSSYQGRKSIDNYGYYLQDQLKVWDRLFITPGLRVDDHEMFGTETTYKISTAYLIPKTGTRLKANWGTGFKAPTLFQLYSSYGSTNLSPEKNKSYDFGIEQNFFQNKVAVDLTYFHNKYSNLVDYNYSTSKYYNVGKAVTKGLELGTKFMPLDNLTLSANFTYTKTEDKETGKELLRHPERQFNFDVNWVFLPKANLNFGANYVGSRKDTGYITDKAYTVFRLAASYDITKDLQVFGRIENLFDKKYQEVYGYETLGRSFYAGIKASF
ncbi:MAG: TonB-dependent receptor [Candidatus Omnitrophota bacterium]